MAKSGMQLPLIPKEYEKQSASHVILSSRQSDRNPFEALCALASLFGWCWKIPCTTCRNQQFQIGLTLIARNLPLEEWVQPRDRWPNWQPRPDWLIGPPRRRPQLNEVEAIRLSDVLANANLHSIRADYKNRHEGNEYLPIMEDWLGYLGVGMFRPSLPSEYREHVGTSWQRQLDQLTGIKSNELRSITFEELEEYEHRFFRIYRGD